MTDPDPVPVPVPLALSHQEIAAAISILSHLDETEYKPLARTLILKCKASTSQALPDGRFAVNLTIVP